MMTPRQSGISTLKKLRKSAERASNLRTSEKRAERLEECLSETLDQFEKVTEDFMERVEDMKLVFEVNRSMSEMLDPDKLLPEIVRLVSARMDVERCSVMLLDDGGENLYVKTGLGFDRPVEELSPSKVGQGISGKVAASGKPLLLKNIESDKRFSKRKEGNYKNNSLLCVPLKDKGKVIGVLNVNNKKDGSFFTEVDLEFLSILAGAAAASWSNASLHRQTQESMRYLNNVVENINSGLMAINPQGQVTLLNRAFKKLFGLGNITLSSPRQLRDILPEGMTRYFNRIVERTWREGDQREVEVEIQANEGNAVPADVSTLLLRNEDLQIQNQLVIVHDLSQSRELVKLRQLDTMKDNFISTVSHELRTPLTSMLASLSLIRQGFAGEVVEAQKNLLKIIHRNAERLKMLINDLLDLSRLESGRTQLNYEMTDLDSLVLECLDDIQHLASEKRIQLKTSLKFASKIRVDSMKIQQVLINLIGNALKFTPEKGHVTVSTCKKDSDACVQVKDDGYGIPPEQQDKIFDRFHQVEDALTRSSTGTGLGLAICKRIVELHGGRIGVKSKVGKGSTFEFILPGTRPARRQQKKK